MLLAGGLALASCAAPDPPGRGLVGSWSAAFDQGQETLRRTLVFAADGSHTLFLEVGARRDSLGGTWHVLGDTLILQLDNRGRPLDQRMAFEIRRDTLITRLTIDGVSGMVSYIRLAPKER